MKILITGGTGFVGSHLSRDCLKGGHEVTILGTSARSGADADPRLHHVAADTTVPGDWQEHAAGADLIFNLAGRNIFKRWSRRYKNQIRDSRILTTRNVVDALSSHKPAVLISTSAVGYYGHCGDTELNEESPPGHDFLSRLAVDWEAEAAKAAAKGARVVVTRFGIVLGRDGGALAKMIPAFRSYVGGPLGRGRQWFPWIHIQDLLHALNFVAARPDLKGPFNLCAPFPVTNAQMADALGQALGRPARLAVPAFMLKMTMGELGEALLSSQRTLPANLLAAGFEFGFSRIQAALADLIKA